MASRKMTSAIWRHWHRKWHAMHAWRKYAIQMWCFRYSAFESNLQLIWSFYSGDCNRFIWSGRIGRNSRTQLHSNADTDYFSVRIISERKSKAMTNLRAEWQRMCSMCCELTLRKCWMWLFWVFVFLFLW